MHAPKNEETKALLAIAEGLNAIALALNRLGINNAATGMGALEVLALEVKEGIQAMSGAIETAGSAIAEALLDERGDEP